MLPLITLTTQFLLIALVMTAVALGATVGFLFLRSRRAEVNHPLSEGERAELQQRDTEIAAIRARIEEIYERQEGGSETQQAVINQRLASLQHHLKARTRQIEGIQSQLQYEMQQRETEMNELRAQLKEAVSAFSAGTLGSGEMKALQAAELPEVEPIEAESPEVELTDEFDSAPDTSFESQIRAFSPDELLTFDPQPADTQEPATDEDDGATDNSDLAFEAASPDPVGDGDAEDDSEDAFAWRPVNLDFDAEPAAAQAQESELEPVEEIEAEAPASLSNDPFADIDVGRPRSQQKSNNDEIQFDSLDSLLEFVPEGDVTEGEEQDVSHSETPDGAADTQNEQAKEETYGDLIQWMSLGDVPDFEDEGSVEPRSSMPSSSESSADSAGASKSNGFAGGDGLPSDVVTARPMIPHTQGRTENLTMLPMIDEDLQEKLYKLGVGSVEEIARLSRADARRIVAHLPGVTEEDIMDEWIFAAQAVLFERYQTELRTRS